MMPETIKAQPDVWMEVKIVLEPAEYHLLRGYAKKNSQSVSELIQKRTRDFIEAEIKKA